jgi:hypothetical protein
MSWCKIQDAEVTGSCFMYIAYQTKLWACVVKLLPPSRCTLWQEVRDAATAAAAAVSSYTQHAHLAERLLIMLNKP